MIPLTLNLRNFLSYGEDVPTLDFTAFHVACVSGRNGHGKSALLDAITWSLWGEARKATADRTPNEGLLRVGATEMQVVFEFNLEGEHYRVSRSYRKTGKSSVSALELQIFSPEDGDYRTLSEEGSVRKTQHRLETLLRMNYDTFINSAFLLQGRADEFTRKGARERKAILSEILGLSRYDDLAVLARDHARKAEHDLSRARDKLEDIEAASTQKKGLQENLQNISEQLEAQDKDLSEKEARLETLRETRAQFEHHRREHDTLKDEITGLEARQKESREQVQAIRKEVAYSQGILNQKDKILANFEQHRTLQAQAGQFQETLRALRPLEQRKNELEKEIAEARHEVERRLSKWNMRVSDTEKELAEIETLLKDQQAVEEKLKALGEARDQNRSLEECRDKSELIERNIRDLERRIQTACADLQVDLKAAGERQRQLEGPAAEHETRKDALRAVRQQIEEAQQLEKDRSRIRETGSTLKSQIEAGEGRLQDLEKDRQEIAAQRTALQDLQEARCPLCGSDLDDQHRTEAHARLAEQDRSRGEEIARLEAELAGVQTEREQHRRQYQEIKNRLTGLEQSHKEAAPLEAAFQEAEKAVEEQRTLNTRVADLEKQIRGLETAGPDARALSEARSELEALSYAPAAHQALRNRIQELEPCEREKARLSAAEERRQKAAETLPEHREKRALADTWLQEKRYAQPTQEALEQLTQEIGSLGYDADEHHKIRQDQERLKDAPTQHERLSAAETEMAGAQARLDAVQSRLDEIDPRLNQNRKRISELEDILAAGEAGAREVRDLQDRIGKTRTERDRLLQERASLETRFKECEARETALPEEKERFKTAEKEIRIYRELTTAFGKDGIQALIIEQAIPEIEAEANRILARLTDNRTQIALESLRDLKKGGTRETLDIRISDELGDRNYELYSGGEAFRVDFAVRIALSKLLASRTGTRLRTLVIDEGFGTQDAEGLDDLVGAIQAIGSDFEKILVITHVEALKQAFPVRIEVTKFPDIGSRFEIIY